MLGSIRVSVKLFAPVVVAAAALLAMLPAGAAAAQFGSECPATLRTTTGTAMQISRAGAPILTTAPGVVTSWAVNNPNYEGVTEKLKVFRPIGAEFEAVAEGTAQVVPKGGLSRFPVRIPVAAGVQFGVYDSVGAPECYNTFTPQDKYGLRAGDVALKSKISSFDFVGEKTVIALVVTVEPDADGDGFGDETQDQCPTNPILQTACPTAAPAPGAPSGGSGATSAALKISAATLEGNTVAVKLSSTAQSQVTVTGTVKGKQAAPAATVTVVPGAVGRAYLALTKAFRRQLAKLPRKRHLTLVIEAQSAGAVPVSREIALPGRKKPRGARQ